MIMRRRVFYVDIMSQIKYSGFNDFHRIGRDIDIDFDWLSEDSLGQDSWTIWQTMLERADALVLTGSRLPKPLQESYSKIFDKVWRGASMLVQCEPATPVETSSLLSKFDMTISEDIIRENRGSSVTFRRESGELADHPILRQVDEVTLTQPQVFVTGPPSVELLMPKFGKEVIFPDTMSNEGRLGVGVESLSCAAVWNGPLDQCVVGLGGHAFRNSFIGCTAEHFPSIARVGNQQFATNLLTRIVRKKLDAAADVTALCQLIEIRLADFVLKVLRHRYRDNWWIEGVPEGIRKECAGRHEEDKLLFPKESYMTLIHLKDVIEKNWTIFDKPFRSAGIVDKRRATDWIGVFNSGDRRMVAHPLKRHFTQHQFTSADLQRIEEWAARSDRLVSIALD